MKQPFLLVFLCGVLLTLSLAWTLLQFRDRGTPHNAIVTPPQETSDQNISDAERIAELLKKVESMDIDALPALPVERFTLPSAGVDVMRVQLEETYEIDGIGTDTVQLTGWIAVKHDNPRPLEGATEITWDTAVVPTEFVGLSLRGSSAIFGPVHVHLDLSQPSQGQVGGLEIPDDVLAVLKADVQSQSKTRLPPK